MQELIKALTVPFVAGFIVQRFLEILDPVTVKFCRDPNAKKLVTGFFSLAIGCGLCGYSHIRIFHELRSLSADFRELPGWLDVLVSGIFISAGTEGFNSVLKFANYKKEASKGVAAEKVSKLDASQLRMVN